MKRPNILLFVTDQQHTITIGNQSICRTPTMNKLISGGVHFEEAYTPTPMCTPARTSIVTGLHPHQHKLLYNSSDAEPYSIQGIETIGSALGSEGYRTAYAGKWHIGKTPPAENGFQEVLPLDSADNRETGLTDVVTVTDRTGEELVSATASYDREDAYAFRLARTVNQWLEERTQSEDDQPFFLMASCTEPHVPWVVPEPYASMYDPADIPEWDNYRSGYEGKPLTYTKHYTGVNFCRLQHDWPKMARALAKYYGMVTMVDDAFATILASLQRHQLMEDTIILFTSDHGELLGKHALIGKNELALDDIIRVPLIVYGQGRFLPGARNEFVSLCDLFNTVMEMAGLELRPHLDSRSLMSYLTGEEQTEGGRKEIVVQHHGTLFTNVIRAIRTKKHKYVFRAHELDEFYDLEHDPSECVNRFGDPTYEALVEEMRARLLEWMERYKDPVRPHVKRYFQNL